MKLYKLVGKIAKFFLKSKAEKKPIGFGDAVQSQGKTLALLLGMAATTRFGKDHRFSQIKDVQTFQKSVPVRNYEAFWREYWRDDFPILKNLTWPGRTTYFAKTSGTTTGKAKYIPCSAEMINSNNNAGLQVVIAHLRNKPNSRVLEGRSFLFGGNPDLEELESGIFAGELSGIAARETKWWAGGDRYYPGGDLARLTDWEEKLEKLSADCLDKDIRAISGLPSWLQILFERIFTNSPKGAKDLKAYFPDLELLVHGGMSFRPYAAYYQKIIRDSDIDIREVYAASEGFFAVADRGYDEGLRLIVDNGIFYEFIRADEVGDDTARRYWLGDVEENVDYALVVTTNAGLWSYVVGDIIRFIDRRNLRLLFSGRLSQTLSVFGEKVVNEELETAVANAAGKMGFSFHDFAVGSEFVGGSASKGQHRYIIELAQVLNVEQEKELAQIIDAELQKLSAGYATRRKNDISIVAPVVVSAPQGSFAKWMKQLGKLGGQNKAPRVLTKNQLASLLEIVLD